MGKDSDRSSGLGREGAGAVACQERDHTSGLPGHSRPTCFLLGFALCQLGSAGAPLPRIPSRKGSRLRLAQDRVRDLEAEAS